MDNDEPIKILLLGESRVGKTSLINVSLGRNFIDDSITTKSCYYSESSFTYNDKTYIYNIWDTAGQEQYRSLNKIFLRKGNKNLLVYSIDNERSFYEIKFWLNCKRKFMRRKLYFSFNSNKADLYEEQIVSEELEREFAQKNSMRFNMTSAKTDSKQFKTFLIDSLKDYIDSLKNKSHNKNSNSIEIKDSKRKQKRKKKYC